MLQVVRRAFPEEEELVAAMSIIEEPQVVGAAGVTGGDKLVRMAHLAVIGCKRVNGVAEMHTSILKVVS